MSQKVSPTTLSLPWVDALWAASALGFTFYAREGLEIARLSTGIISNVIAPAARRVIGLQAEVFPSEPAQRISECTDFTGNERIRYAKVFNWAVFFVSPLALSLLLVYWRWCEIWHLPAPTVPPVACGALVAIVADCWVFRLLWKYPV